MSDKLNENSENKEQKDELEINADSPKYEENDNWEFEATAQTLGDTVIENEEMVIEIPEKKPSYETRERPKAKTEKKSETSDDEKKPKSKKDEKNTTKFLIAAILTVIVIGALIFLGIRYYTVPATIGATQTHEVTNPGNVTIDIDGTKVTAGMYSYYYNQILNSYASQAQQGYYDLDVTKDLSKQNTEDSDGKKLTWQQRIQNETEDWLRQLVAYYSKGVEEGMTLSKDDKKTIDDEIKTVKDSAKSAKQSVDQYVKENYGEYVTVATLRKSNEWYLIAQEYARKMATEIHPTADEAKDYYNKHQEEFAQVKFCWLPMTFTDSNKADVQKQAEKYAKNIKTSKDLISIIPEACKDIIDQYVESGQFGDANSVIEQITQTIETTTTKDNPNQFPDQIISFLFNSGNKAGTCKTFTDEQYGVVYIVLKESDPQPVEDETYSVRHILITPFSKKSDGTEEYVEDTTKATDEQWKNADQKAKEIYNEFLKSNKSEYQFALLAEKYSKDPGSVSSGGQGAYGGLYYKTSLGSMVAPFEKWSTDKSRKYGDTGIVKTDYGYHIMYFVDDQPDYIMDCKSAVSLDKEDAFIDSYKMEKSKRIIDKVITASNEKVKKTYAASSSAQSSSSDDSVDSSESETEEPQEEQSTTQQSTTSK